MWDIILESVRAVITGGILIYLLIIGKKADIQKQPGWQYIILGFAFIFFGMVVDISDNFDSLNRYIIIGDTKYEAFLEKVVGFLIGFLLLAIGFWKWIPVIIELRETRNALERSYGKLEDAKNIAEAASKTKSEFIANMSHELRTPLNSIVGFSDIMHKGIAGEMTDDQKGYVKDIHESSNKLLALINGILDMGQIDSGKMGLDYSSLNIKDLIEESIYPLKPQALKQNMKFQVEVESGVGTIEADEIQLRKVLGHLLENGLKFTPDGGVITVRAKRKVDIPGLQGDHLELSVKDTGSGIKSDDMPKLFRPFQQLEEFYTKKHEGVGLGLYFCKRIIEEHGGKIWAESEVGKGSRFVFVIPYKADKDNSEK